MSFRAHPRGVALVITLMMMSVLTLMVVGLAGVMRNEQAAARNLTYVIAAEQAAEIGKRQAIAAILSNSPTNGALSASGPGWISSNNTLSYLFPANTNVGVKNLEEIGTNSLILSLSTNRSARGELTMRGRIVAGWSNLVHPTNRGGDRPFARFTWWVDDEGGKANLNLLARGDATPENLPLGTNPRTFSANWILVAPTNGSNFATAGQSNALQDRIHPFWSPDAIKDPMVVSNSAGGRPNTPRPDQYRQIKGSITAWSDAADLTPWGTARINLNDPSLTVEQLVAAMNTNVWTTLGFSSNGLARKYGGGNSNAGLLVMTQIAANILGAAGQPIVATNFGGRRDNLAADHPNRHRNGLPRDITSLHIGPYLEEVRVRFDGRVTGQSNVEGRLAILVQVVQPFSQVASTNDNQYTIIVQPRKFRFRAVPDGVIPANDDVEALSSSPLPGIVGVPRAQTAANSGPGWYVGPEWFGGNIEPWPTNNPLITTFTINQRDRQAFIFTHQIQYRLRNNKRSSQVRDGYVILDSVKLCRGANNLMNVIDWVSLDDFSQADNYGPTNAALSDRGQMNLIAGVLTNTPLNATNFGSLGAGTFMGGLRRIDPRARFAIPFWHTNDSMRGRFADNGMTNTVRAWTTSANFRATNRDGSVTGISYLWPDSAPLATDSTNHPHFVSGYQPTNLTSVAQLGAIHTGIPWRTLRLQPQPVEERTGGGGGNNYPPDWVLLDLFTVTNPTLSRPMFNPNGLYASLILTNGEWRPGPALNSDGSRPSRPWAFLSALGSFTTTNTGWNTNLAVSNGVPASLRTNTLTYAQATNLGAALTNALANQVAGWSLDSRWRDFRAANAGRFPSNNALLLRGEILELAGLAEETNTVTPRWGEDVLEGRLRGFFDRITTRSDTFSVWSAGEGLATFTNNFGLVTRTNTMGEVRQQTVVQRVPLFRTNAAPNAATNYTVTNWTYRVLYTRQHTLD